MATIYVSISEWKREGKAGPKQFQVPHGHITWGPTLGSQTCLPGQGSVLRAGHPIHVEQHGFRSQLLDQPVSYLSAWIWESDPFIRYIPSPFLPVHTGSFLWVSELHKTNGSVLYRAGSHPIRSGGLEDCILMCGSVEMTQDSQASPLQGNSVGVIAVCLSGT